LGGSRQKKQKDKPTSPLSLEGYNVNTNRHKKKLREMLDNFAKGTEEE